MMSVPEHFRWSDIPFEKLNALTEKKNKPFLKEEINIRQSLGEAVPTIILGKLPIKFQNSNQKNIAN